MAHFPQHTPAKWEFTREESEDHRIKRQAREQTLENGEKNRRSTSGHWWTDQRYLDEAVPSNLTDPTTFDNFNYGYQMYARQTVQCPPRDVSEVTDESVPVKYNVKRVAIDKPYDLGASRCCQNIQTPNQHNAPPPPLTTGYVQVQQGCEGNPPRNLENPGCSWENNAAGIGQDICCGVYSDAGSEASASCTTVNSVYSSDLRQWDGEHNNNNNGNLNDICHGNNNNNNKDNKNNNSKSNDKIVVDNNAIENKTNENIGHHDIEMDDGYFYYYKCDIANPHESSNRELVNNNSHCHGNRYSMMIQQGDDHDDCGGNDDLNANNNNDYAFQHEWPWPSPDRHHNYYRTTERNDSFQKPNVSPYDRYNPVQIALEAYPVYSQNHYEYDMVDNTAPCASGQRAREPSGFICRPKKGTAAFPVEKCLRGIRLSSGVDSDMKSVVCRRVFRTATAYTPENAYLDMTDPLVFCQLEAPRRYPLALHLNQRQQTHTAGAPGYGTYKIIGGKQYKEAPSPNIVDTMELPEHLRRYRDYVNRCTDVKLGCYDKADSRYELIIPDVKAPALIPTRLSPFQYSRSFV